MSKKAWARARTCGAVGGHRWIHSSGGMTDSQQTPTRQHTEAIRRPAEFTPAESGLVAGNPPAPRP